MIGWAIAETALVPPAGSPVLVYDYSKNKVAGSTQGTIPDSWLARRLESSQAVSPAERAGLRNAIVSYGALGAVLCLAMGIAGGLIQQSLFRSGFAGVTGLVLGGLAGVVMARLLAPVYYTNRITDDLRFSLIMYGGIWGTVSTVAGLAFGLELGEWSRTIRAVIGGATAALIASAIYEFAGGIQSPRAMTNMPVSFTWPTRLAAQSLVSMMVAAGVVLCDRLSLRDQVTPKT